MKTELIHSYSTASLAALAKSDSSLSLSTEFNPGGYNRNTPTNDTGIKDSKLGLVNAVAKEWWAKTARRKTVTKQAQSTIVILKLVFKSIHNFIKLLKDREEVSFDSMASEIHNW